MLLGDIKISHRLHIPDFEHARCNITAISSQGFQLVVGSLEEYSGWMEASMTTRSDRLLRSGMPRCAYDDSDIVKNYGVATIVPKQKLSSDYTTYAVRSIFESFIRLRGRIFDTCQINFEESCCLAAEVNSLYCDIEYNCQGGVCVSSGRTQCFQARLYPDDYVEWKSFVNDTIAESNLGGSLDARVNCCAFTKVPFFSADSLFKLFVCIFAGLYFASQCTDYIFPNCYTNFERGEVQSATVESETNNGLFDSRSDSEYDTQDSSAMPLGKDLHSTEVPISEAAPLRILYC